MVLKLCVHCDPSNLWEGHPSPGRQEPPHAPVSIGVPTLVHSHVLSYPWGGDHSFSSGQLGHCCNHLCLVVCILNEQNVYFLFFHLDSVIGIQGIFHIPSGLESFRPHHD